MNRRAASRVVLRSDEAMVGRGKSLRLVRESSSQSEYEHRDLSDFFKFVYDRS